MFCFRSNSGSAFSETEELPCWFKNKYQRIICLEFVTNFETVISRTYMFSVFVYINKEQYIDCLNLLCTEFFIDHSN